LAEIQQQLHFRHALGFKPEALDGKRRKLRVKLADAVKNQHKGVRLGYRVRLRADPPWHQAVLPRVLATHRGAERFLSIVQKYSSGSHEE
jgi:hypothetical protein